MLKQYEDVSAGNIYREKYLDSVNNLIEQKQQESYNNRQNFSQHIIVHQEEYREKFKQMLGWPLTQKRPQNINVRMTKVDLIRDYEIYRVEFEVFDDFWYYGILFKHCGNAKRPLTISQHGGKGTPELCSGMFGDDSNYNGMTQRIFNMGTNVFVPQMLLWDMGQDEKENSVTDLVRRTLDKDLKQLGGSITALEIYCLQTTLDYFEKQEYVDKKKIAMAGLSYGGFYTQFLTAIDTRIKRALTSSQFNDRTKYNWSDWTWFNSANTFGDAEIAMLIYPRKFTICVGRNDGLFSFKEAQKEYERLLKQMCEYKVDWIEFTVFEGAHEFIKDDVILKKALFE